MSPRICILCLIGLPAAGKTTFSHGFMAQKQLNFNIMHLCYDNFLQFPLGANEITFKLQRLEIMKILQQLVEAIRQNQTIPDHLKDRIKSNEINAAKDFLIICDDNNYYRSMRYKLYQFTRNNRLAYAQIYFECPLEIACERNAKRAQSDKVEVHIMHQMSQRLEAPNVQEQSWEANTLKLNIAACQDASTAAAIISFILKAFENVLEPPVGQETLLSNATPALPSIVHQVDILLRHSIKELLNKSLSSAAKLQKANELNAKRKEILQELRESGTAAAVLNEIDLKKFVDYLQ